MRKINVLMLGLLVSLAGFSQQNTADKFFEKYAGKEGFTTVNINGNLLKLVSNFSDDNEVDPLLMTIESVKILSAEDKVNSPDFYEEIMKDLPQNNYEELMTVRDSDQRVKIMVKEKNGVINELLLVAGGDNDNALIIIRGSIPMKELNHLSRSLNMDGLEVLSDLELDNVK